MTSINPFSGFLAQGTQVERAQAGEKSRQVRRTQALSKNVAARDDELEHQVESTEAVAGVKDDHSQQQGKKKQNKRDGTKEDEGEEDAPRLDITA